MNYSSKKLATVVASVPLLLTGLIILFHDSQPHATMEEVLDIILLMGGLLLSVLFYFYLKHLSQTTGKILEAISDFEASGDVEGLPVERDDELGRLGRAIARIFKREKQHIIELEEVEAKLCALFEVVNEGIVIANEQGLIEDVNQSLCTMLGYEADELKGQNVSIMMPAPYSVHHDRYMHSALDSGSMGFMGMYRDLKALRKDGSSFAVELSVDHLKVSGCNYFAATMRDVSEQRQHEQQLINAKIKAEVANEAKSNFLSMMSHEIRTPLNGVMGTLELLADELQGAEQKELLSIASRSANSLLHIVNDVLDMSKVESGKLELEAADFDLADVLQEAVELYSSKALEKGLTLGFEQSGGLTFRLIGDAHRLRQMINNLLGNAIKFTHTGTVDIHADWRELDANSIEISISVSDTGIGVSANKLDMIFEPFMQEDNSISREYGGTGLGLSIVKHLAEKMGGSIRLESTRGVGSRFILTLPFQLSREHRSAEVNVLQGATIVCIDLVDESLQEYMQNSKANIRSVTWAEISDERAPLVMQSDLTICGNGSAEHVDVINQWMEAINAEQHIVVVADSAEAWEAGLDARAVLLRRPLLANSLDSLFRSLYDSKDRIKTPSVAPGNTMKKILLVEDNPVNQMVARAMLEKMGYQVVVANNGEEGVAVIREQSIDLILMDLHMPVMDGYEATRQIRELKGRELPILAMTADAGMADKDNCLAAGMDDHLPKPIKMDVLEQVLESWLAA